MMGIGQGRLISVTPLQMAVAYSTLANGGTRYAARIVDRIEISGEAARVYEAIELGKVEWSRAQHNAIVRGLRSAANSSRGTARRAGFNPEWGVAGKTGTAETSGAEPHAWFACFAPWKSPEICLVVLLENAGHGGEEAAPLAREILEEYFRLKAERALHQAP